MSHYGNSRDDRYNDRSSYRGGGGGGMGGGGGRFGGDSMGAMGDKLRSIQWDLSSLPVFEKNFYIEHPAVTQRDDRWADDWRKNEAITVIGHGIPKVFPLPLFLLKSFVILLLHRKQTIFSR
jgi:ATP-dependent RNA helicase DDX5/DBP2